MPLILFFGGGRWIWNIKDKYEYQLFLKTSSGESSVLTRESKENVSLIKNAITDAIVYRG
jgi:hypothetical protein